MFLLPKSWIVIAVSLISWGNAFIVPRPSPSFSLTTSLEAKKKGKKGSTAGQGFSQEPPPPAPKTPPTPTESSVVSESIGTTPLQSIESGGSDAIPVMQDSELDPNLPPEERTKILLREKYGLRTREEQDRETKKEEKRKEQRKRERELQKLAEEDKDVDIMAMLPAPVLIAIDRFLKIGVAVCTVAFVAAGVGITVEAWSKVTDNPLPEDIDNFIVNVVEPNFTPGLGVLLAFSVGLGVFAAAQLGSDSSQYKEDN